MLTQAQQTDIRRLYCEEKLGTRRIESILGIGHGAIANFLEQEGIRRNRKEAAEVLKEQYAAGTFTPQQAPCQMTPELHEQVLTSYSEGRSIARVAKDHGLSFNRVHRLLDAAGVIRERHHTKRLSERKHAACPPPDKGYAIRGIAENGVLPRRPPHVLIPTDNLDLAVHALSQAFSPDEVDQMAEKMLYLRQPE